MPVADREHTQIFWEEQGSGEPLLLVMGHGWPRQMWARHLPALTERFRVFTFDNRGVGQTATTLSQWTLADMADDALAVLDAAGVTRAHVYGASMGGGIAQVMTLDHPDRVGALILGCTAAKAARRHVPLWPVMRRLLPALPAGRQARTIALARALVYGPATDPALIAEDLRLLESLRRPAEGLRAQRQAVLDYEGSQLRLSSIRSPTLIIHGSDDRLVPLRYGQELARLIPGADLVVLPRAGHMYITDATQAADSAVLSFLAAHPLQPT
jgi:pimeloyl-ACP methyl ester carboxylesterase